jgi:hypothetical protein
MTRRGRTIGALAALAAVVGALVVVMLSSFGRPVATSKVATAAPVGPATDRVPEGISVHLTPREDVPARTHAPVVVDIARVEAALARIQESAAKVTPEQLAEEQQKMLAAKARFEAIEIAEPKQRKFTDEHGTRWIELQHESGELRYQLDPGDEAADAEPAR